MLSKTKAKYHSWSILLHLIMPCKHLLLFATIALLINACDTNTATNAPEQRANGPKNGEWINRRPDGTLETRVNYKDGLKHGVSYLYYADGKTIQLAIPYASGKKNGASKKYYEDGSVYTEATYTDNKLHGVRKTYFRSGQLQSEQTFSTGLPGLDLNEYYKSGKRIPKPSIITKRQGDTIYVSVDSDECRKSSFYVGKLREDAYLPSYAELESLGGSDGNFEIDLTIFTPSYLALQNVICECQTSFGNRRLIVSKLKF